VIGDGRDVLLSSCNYDCMCNSTLFEPVCGVDDLTYFSPCRAGCQKSYIGGNQNVCKIKSFHVLLILLNTCTLTKQVPIFENCTCVAENLSKDKTINDQHTVLIGEYIGNSTASNGKCKTNCRNLGPFLFCVGILVFFIFLLKIPTILVTIR
jgi:hypothetical protein